VPLQVVQIDHTLVDVVVVDELERLPLGRPWLTLAVDVASRMVTGFYVSLDPVCCTGPYPSGSSKRSLALRPRTGLAWPVSGLPELVHLDNAPEFKSEALERGTEEYGIKLLYRPTGRPHFGGHCRTVLKP
jgi:putative transposase